MVQRRQDLNLKRREVKLDLVIEEDNDPKEISWGQDDIKQMEDYQSDLAQ